MEEFKPRILVVDDDPSWQELLTEVIAGLPSPSDLTVAGSYPEADALLDHRHFYMAFVDLRLREDSRDLEGKRLVQKIVEQGEGTSVVIATAHADVNTAIIALKQWRVLDFLLKDEWNPDRVAELVAKGVAAARSAYSRRFESALDVLVSGTPIMNWLARLLDLIDPEAAALPGADRRASALLNELLAGLYPLLPLAGRPSVQIDEETGMATGVFWSKALGTPVSVAFGSMGKIDALQQGVPGFAVLHRHCTDERLRLAGAVYAPAVPAFTSFERN